MEVSRTVSAYKQRYHKCEAILFCLMIIIVAVAGFYIFNEGLNNRAGDTTTTTTTTPTSPAEGELGMWIDLYTDTGEDLSGILTIRTSDGSIFQTLTVDQHGIVIEEVIAHPIGTYTIDYVGTTNGITFGPVQYNVQYADTLLVDEVYFGVRLTIRTR